MLKRFLIFLTLVSIVCGAFYLSSPKKPVERAEPVWPVLNKDQVDRLDVCSLGEDCFSLVRRTDGWGVAQHGWNGTVEADLTKVNSLLDVLAQDKALRFMGRVSEPVPAEYGFESPRLRIAAGGGQELAISVGSENPSGEGFYALNSKEEGSLFLLGEKMVSRCEFPAEYYYNLHLISGNPDEVVAISLGHGGSFSWTLVRKDGPFMFSFPAPLGGKQASGSEVDLFLHSLLEVPAKGLVSSIPNKENRILLNIEISLSGKKVETLEIFEPGDGEKFYFARSSSQSGYLVLSKEHYEQLDKKAFAMQQRNVVSIATGKLGTVRVVQGNQTFTGIKSDKSWINFEDKKPLLGIDMSLWRLNELKFEAEPKASLSETSEKVMDLELMDESGKRVVKVSFYSDPELPDGQCWLSLGDGSGYYPVSDKLLEDLQGQIPLRK
ncbi:hypothetical protein Desal_2589 [Maridesulfovibrio salexigens DSM 2638]|uniref:Uncharacterized protein n=1 Tax=Maridesulfovibrio salexigens (strain ATCC 14822 / DSM 2638 / NCIMB 8403 / VKM B-1763) TaxID=526222 RepID=C6BYN7_MARSD|nr:hypothetical protein Desal_2589 [Maridesulfovibrio salexigens DSM 2638]